MQKVNCKNCGEIVHGRYCGHCGQSAKVGKINLSSFLNEISESVFQVNRGLFYTLGKLFIEPGVAINEFLDGKRKRYFKPLGYVLALSTIYFFVSHLSGTNTWMNDIISGFSNAANDSGDAAETVPPVLLWLSKNFAYTNLLLLPIFSFASFLCFWGLGRNYLEHIVLNAYVTGQQAIFWSAFLLPIKIIEDTYYLEVMPFTLSISYAFWVFWQVFPAGNRAVIILRALLTYVIYFLLSFTLLFAVSAIQQGFNQ